MHAEETDRLIPFQRAFMTLLLSAAGTALAGFFALGVVLPLQAAVVTMLVLAIGGFSWVRIGAISALTRVSVLAYALPFAVTLGYLFNRNFKWWPTPEAIQLMSDELLIRQMIAVGTVGLIGLIVGIRLANRPLPPAPPRPTVNEYSMSAPLYSAILLFAIGLSWISAPKGTLLTGAYSEIVSSTAATDLHFNSAYFISYVIFVIAFLDSERTANVQLRKYKLATLAIVVAYVVIFLQLLRGDRESSGALVALAGLYLTSPSAHETWQGVLARHQHRLRRMLMPAFLVVLLYALVGAVRNDVAAARRGAVEIDPVLTLIGLQSSWTAVLLTNLAIGAQYRAGDMDLLYGETYVDYALSLPPSLVTNALGIERPLEPTTGPSWWSLGIGIGGIHAALVPFKNFGIFGVLLILSSFGFLIGRIERASLYGGFWGRLLLGTMLSTVLFWFWYGDMYVIRALMIAALIGVPYRTMCMTLAQQPQLRPALA
jgi:hypothetical protein